MEKIKKHIPYLIFLTLLCLWSALCFVLPDFMDNPIINFRGALTIAIYVVAITISQFFLFYLASAYRGVFAVFLPIYALFGAIVSYYRVVYHATITPMIIDATLHTNAGTVAGVVSLDMFAWILLQLLVSACFVWFRWRKISLSYAWVHLLVATILFSGYYWANSRLHQSINQRYPMVLTHNVSEYCQLQRLRKQPRLPLHPITVSSTEPVDVIFILGEAMRADHLSLNGYERQTTPSLEKQTNCNFLPNVYSEYTYTAMSVPHILTAADSLQPEIAGQSYSFVRYFKEAGYRTYWISNQDMGHTYAAIIQEADSIIFPNAEKSVFVFDPWYDEDLIQQLDTLCSNELYPRNLYVLHTIGSHWYYNIHVPDSFQIFQPVATSRTVTHNSPEQVINSYDNTALYLDYILNSIMNRFANRCAIMLYLSDHGEALGENGKWLHAGSVDAMHYPAALVWYSDLYAQQYPKKVSALKENRTKRYRTDYLFHSILSAGGIEIERANKNLDIFSR